MPRSWNKNSDRLNSQREILRKLALMVAAWFFLGPVGRGDEVQPLDTRQIKIANTVIDKIVERIKALKPQYPELGKFGEAPYFTRGDGEFRYDYKIEKVVVDGKPQAKALPGGCGIYCRFYAPGTPESKWFLYYQWASFGGQRAGITREIAVTVYKKSDDDNTQVPLVDAIRDAEQKEWEGTCARLTSEYVLSQKGVALDTPSLLDAAENRDLGVNENAMIALSFRALTPVQLARIRQAFRERKASMGEAHIALQIMEEQDRASVPGFLSDLFTLSLQNKHVTQEATPITPFFNDAWPSEARNFRQVILSHLKDGEPLDLVPAEKILSSDTVLDDRLNALEYIAKQPGDAAQKLLVGALQNSFRSVQVEAAQECGQKKIAAAVDGLRALLNSSSPKVRTAAATSLRQLNQTVPNPIPIPPLPDSARQMAAPLWQHGLRDEDFLVVHALPWPDKHLMSSLDPDSLKKVTTVYVTPDPRHEVPWEHRFPPGPFLLAAAIKFKDDDSARLIYGRMCDIYETDDGALEDGMNSLGWDRFSVALDDFHQKKDEAALAQFAEVIALSDAARPFTLLSIYVSQSRELTQYLKTQTPDKEKAEPGKTDTAAYVNFWIDQLKGCDGSHPTEAGENIRSVGLVALPMLIEALSNKTPTRNFSYGRSYFPQRDLIYVGDAAKTLIGVICRDYGLNPVDPVQFANARPLDLQEKLRKWVKTIPADTKLVPLEKRDQALLYPAGRYYWGDD